MSNEELELVPDEQPGDFNAAAVLFAHLWEQIKKCQPKDVQPLELAHQICFDLKQLYDVQAMEVARMRELASNAMGDAARHLARLNQLAQTMPVYLDFFITTFEPFRPQALTEEYRAHLTTAANFVELLKQFE